MERLSIFVPKTYIETLDILVTKSHIPNRSEAIRMAIRTFIQQEIELLKTLERRKGIEQNSSSSNDNSEKR